MPKELELLLEQVSPNRLEVVVEQLGQPRILLLGKVFPAYEPQLAAFAQDRLVAFVFERLGLTGPHLTERFAKMGHDVETIQHVHGLAGLFGDDFQIRFPHVAANVVQPGATCRTEPAENPRTAS